MKSKEQKQEQPRVIRRAAAIKEVYEENGRVRVRTINPLPTKTQQQYKDRCDINKIMKNYMKTGELPRIRAAQGFYLDHTVLPQDYQQSLDLVLKANAAFENLPSEFKFMCGNDPKKLLEKLNDKNMDQKFKEEAIKLGLLAEQQQVVEPAKSAERQKAEKDDKTKKTEDHA